MIEVKAAGAKPSYIEALPWGAIFTYADANGLSRRDVAACILVETLGDPHAVRFEPKWKYFKDVPRFAKLTKVSAATEKACQAISWGPMQIMGSVARELGFQGHLTELSSNSLGINFGCRKLAKCFKKYGNIQDAISAFNAGSSQRQKDGSFGNAEHMSRFNKYLDELKKFGH